VNILLVLGTIGRGRFTVPKLAHYLKWPHYLYKQLPTVMPQVAFTCRSDDDLSQWLLELCGADPAKIAQVEDTIC
jgi:pyrroloquinoline quinone (PQQ) biosynthesis protein C